MEERKAERVVLLSVSLIVDFGASGGPPRADYLGPVCRTVCPGPRRQALKELKGAIVSWSRQGRREKKLSNFICADILLIG